MHFCSASAANACRSHHGDHVEHAAAMAKGGGARRSCAHGSRTGARGARDEQLAARAPCCSAWHNDLRMSFLQRHDGAQVFRVRPFTKERSIRERVDQLRRGKQLHTHRDAVRVKFVTTERCVVAWECELILRTCAEFHV